MQHALEETANRLNGFAAMGEDLDFERGGTNYQQYHTHPTYKPNASLGPASKAPFYTVQREVYSVLGPCQLPASYVLGGQEMVGVC